MPRLAEPPVCTRRVHYLGREYECCLVPNARNRHIRLRIVPPPGKHFSPQAWPLDSPQLDLLSPAQFAPVALVVSFPPRLPVQKVLETVESHLPWVVRQDRKLSRTHSLFWIPTRTGEPAWLAGRRLTLLIFPWKRPNPEVRMQASYLVCYTPREHPPTVRRALEKWYRQQTQERIQARISCWARQITEKTYRVKVRTQRSRWGSCSARGVLTFNWKLSMLPETVADYVMVHELTHLEELNHSKRFWQRLCQHYPAYTEARQWLRLHALGPEP